MPCGFCQTNSLGLYVDIDGEIKFWEGERNLRGYIKDTVLITFGKKTFYEDLGNLKQIDLTLLEYPKDNWHMLTQKDDTFQINDPSFESSLINGSFTIPDSIVFSLIHNIDSSKYEPNELLENRKIKYMDNITGDGLTDSIVDMLKVKLALYVKRYYGKTEPDKARHELYLELSDYDSIVNKIEVYDYLVDQLILYDYTHNQLNGIIRYHWNTGVEFDSLRYDESGQLVYFSRESIGSSRDEFYFEYNQFGKVIKTKCFLAGYVGDSESDLKKSYTVEYITYAYDEYGVLNSKSLTRSNGSLEIYFYEFK